ncbi:MAG: hypothetical protein M3X11_06990, partial [Acidobacteriota bacterium]|nr:hypothetical protein [Acidobacteriota bacterium]
MTPRRFPITFVLVGFILTCLVFLGWRAGGASAARPMGQADGRQAPAAAERDAHPALAQPQPATGTIVRTLVYHEITALPVSVDTGGLQPRLSKNGNRALFIVPPESLNPRLRIVNFDGSGERELDAAVQPAEFSLGIPDISADGARIVYTQNFRGQNTIVDVGGNAGGDRKRVFAYHNGGSPGRARISGDGSTVFCDTSGSGGLFLPNGTQLRFGVHAFNAADGSYLRQVVTAEAIAQLFGLTPASLLHSDLALNSLSVSHNGGRIAFVVRVNGDHAAFSVNFDGTGLVSLLGSTLAEARQGFVEVGISGDGLKVAYNLTKLDGTTETGVVAASGNQATRKILLSVPFNTVSPLPTGLPTRNGDLIELNTDGSILLLGSTGVLADTVTNDPEARFLQLAVGHGTSDINSALVADGMPNATMNGNATRFLYHSGNTNGVRQLVTLEINPANRAQSPAVSEPKTDPTFLLTGARSEMTM